MLSKCKFQLCFEVKMFLFFWPCIEIHAVVKIKERYCEGCVFLRVAYLFYSRLCVFYFSKTIFELEIQAKT